MLSLREKLLRNLIWSGSWKEWVGRAEPSAEGSGVLKKEEFVKFGGALSLHPAVCTGCVCVSVCVHSPGLILFGCQVCEVHAQLQCVSFAGGSICFLSLLCVV